MLDKKTLKRLSDYYNFYLNHYFGDFSRRRRLRKMSFVPIDRKLHRLDLKGKRVLIIVAHCDDEVVWANTVLTSDEPARKDLFVIYDGGRLRNRIIKKVAKLASANLYHLKIVENLHPIENALAYIREEDVKKVKRAIKKKLLFVKYDYIFTHNEFGEYGHGQHRQIHRMVKDIVKEINYKTNLIFFGYAYPLMFDKTTTFWPETLKVFATDRKWTKHSDIPVKPFRGIFKFKKYPEYFYHDTNCYLPQRNRELMLKLASSYKKAKDAWLGWLKPSSHYYQYLSNHVQYFSDSSLCQEKYIEYEWPTFTITPFHPLAKKKRLSDLRTFLDDNLIDYLHFEGDVLWIGWDSFCVKNNYSERVLKYAESLDLLDNNKLRRSQKIYGEQAANIIGDLCNLDCIVESEKYDCIYCNGVLEYVNSIEKAISQCSRILKKRGRVLFGLPGYDWSSTGKNRPHFEYIIDLIYKNNLLPIEVWRRINPDYYYIHAFKSAND